MTDHQPTQSRVRIAISNGCAAAGVLLLLLAGLSPAEWFPVVQLFLGLALVAVADVLTPCESRIDIWRRGRADRVIE